MTSFVDFQAVKEAVSFGEAVSLLSLDLKKNGQSQWRGSCPVCGGERSLVVTDGRGYYCWGAKKGGDVIALAAHVLELGPKEAAQELAERAGIVPSRNSTRDSTSRTVPESEEGTSVKLQPLPYLEPAHESVIAVGLAPDFCETHGIGYAPRGVVRGSIAIPFRDERGKLLGYFGVQELTYVPPDFQGNVTPFERKRA